MTEHLQPISEPSSIRNSDKPFGKWKGRRGQPVCGDGMNYTVCCPLWCVNSFHTTYIKVSSYEREKVFEKMCR